MLDKLEHFRHGKTWGKTKGRTFNAFKSQRVNTSAGNCPQRFWRMSLWRVIPPRGSAASPHGVHGSLTASEQTAAQSCGVSAVTTANRRFALTAMGQTSLFSPNSHVISRIVLAVQVSLRTEGLGVHEGFLTVQRNVGLQIWQLKMTRTSPNQLCFRSCSVAFQFLSSVQ